MPEVQEEALFKTVWYVEGQKLDRKPWYTVNTENAILRSVSNVSYYWNVLIECFKTIMQTFS